MVQCGREKKELKSFSYTFFLSFFSKNDMLSTLLLSEEIFWKKFGRTLRGFYSIVLWQRAPSGLHHIIDIHDIRGYRISGYRISSGYPISGISDISGYRRFFFFFFFDIPHNYSSSSWSFFGGSFVDGSVFA